MTDQVEFPMAIWVRPAFPLNSEEELLRVYRIDDDQIDASDVVGWLKRNNLAGCSDLIDYLVYRCNKYELDAASAQQGKNDEINHLGVLVQDLEAEKREMQLDLEDEKKKIRARIKNGFTSILEAQSRDEMLERIVATQDELFAIVGVTSCDSDESLVRTQ